MLQLGKTQQDVSHRVGVSKVLLVDYGDVTEIRELLTEDIDKVVQDEYHHWMIDTLVF